MLHLQYWQAGRFTLKSLRHVWLVCRGRPTDVYALGACLYTFVFGRIPFNAASVFKLFQVVQHEPLRFPSQPQVSHELKDLLHRMLAKVTPCCLPRTPPRSPTSPRISHATLPTGVYALLMSLCTARLHDALTACWQEVVVKSDKWV